MKLSVVGLKATWARWKPRLTSALWIGVAVAHYIFEWTWDTIFWIAFAYVLGTGEVRRLVVNELIKRRLFAEETVDINQPDRSATHLLPRVWRFDLSFASDYVMRRSKHEVSPHWHPTSLITNGYS